MRFHKEAERLKDTESALELVAFRFGPNKRQELTRLIYELSKIKSVSPKILIDEALGDNNFQDSKQAFIYLKDYFLAQRFPRAHRNKDSVGFYLPKLNIDKENVVTRGKGAVFYPKEIFIEKDAADYILAKSIIKRFPLAKVNRIDKFKNYIKVNNYGLPIINYNNRRDKLFLIKEKYDFLKPCPCSKGVVGCGYYILNLGFGCVYECSYCFLQSYTNVFGIVIPVNIEDYLGVLDNFLKRNKRKIRIGTGEFTDSLALDNLTDFSKTLIQFFSRKENAALELKTKSNNINHILDLKHNKKTVISWSLNPQPLVASDEWRANTLEERLVAAKKCCQAGYPVGFHFDPIIYSKSWETLYRNLLDRLFKEIKPENIAWISFGTFRFSPSLKIAIEQRFPQSKILDEELVLGFDKKLRYGTKQRIAIYKKMYSWISSYSKDLLVYLCMEPKEIWQDVLARTKF